MDFFWKKWNKPYRNYYNFLFSVFLLFLVGLLIADVLREEIFIGWEVVPEIDSVKTSLDSFSQYLFNFTIDADAFLLRERYIGGVVEVYPIFSYIFLGILMVGFITALALLTYMELVWFIAGMVAFIFYLATIHTEMLQAFGQGDHKFLIVMILFYGGVGYYFHSFNKNIHFFKRIAAFLLLTAFFGVLLGMSAKVENPFLYLANFGIMMPVVISVIFFIIISFDILKAFLYITTDAPNTTKRNNLLSFIVISLLYLINVVFLYLKKGRVIDWDIVYFNAFYIYIVSAILGIWSYKKRSQLFKDIIPFAPNGAYYYLALGIITTATITFALITGNDPLAESLEYWIIYTQLAFGTIFFLYVLINFVDVFNKTSVYKIVYQMRRVPFFMVRGVGIAVLIALFFFSKKFPYYLALSGHYNLISDIFNYEGNTPEARLYSKEGVVWEFQNHRSNYSAAALAQKEGDYNEALEYYERASVKRPLKYAYVNLSNIYRQQDMFFPAIFKLRDGLNHFPKNAQLNNNLGLLYNKTALKDSAIYYLEMARENASDEVVPLSNKLSVLLQENLISQADSLLIKYDRTDHLAFLNNKMVLFNLKKQKSGNAFDKSFFSDSLLNNTNFSYLYNHGLNRYNTADTSFMEVIREAIKINENEVYKDDLNFISALKEWYQGDKAVAREMLDRIAGIDYISNASVTRTVGLLLLRDQAYGPSSDYFRRLIPKQGQQAYLQFSLSLLMEGDYEGSKEGLNNLKESENPEIKRISNNLINILATDRVSLAMNWEEPLKYQYMVFKRNQISEKDLLDLYKTFYEPVYKQMAASAVMMYYIEKGKPSDALNFYHKLDQYKQENTTLNFQYLRALSKAGKWDELEKGLSIALAKEKEDYRVYFKGLVHEGRNDGKEAGMAFDRAVERLPFDEEVIVSIAAFFNSKNEGFKAYEILLRSLRHMPDNVGILKAYSLQSLKLNLTTYADDTFERLKALLSKEEYAAFKKIYDAEKLKIEANSIN